MTSHGGATADPVPPLRIVICDDHTLFAQLLASALEAQGHLVTAVSDPDKATEVAASREVDIVFMDLSFPQGDGMTGIRSVREASPPTKVLVLSASTHAHTIATAMAQGAHGFVAKDAGMAAISGALQDLMTGRAVFRPGGRKVDAKPPARPAGSTAAESLTPRERQVLQLLSEGHGTQSLANLMHVSSATARTHVQSMLQKLGVHSRIEAIGYATRHQLVRLPPTRTG